MSQILLGPWKGDCATCVSTAYLQVREIPTFYIFSELTLPWPQRTNVPIKAIFLLCEMPPLAFEEGIISIVLLAGSVSPVKLDSSIFKSTACKTRQST